MAEEVYSFTANIPAGTAIATPVTVDMSTPTRTIDRIQIVVPTGPNGLVGFAIANAGVPVIPRNRGGWIIANGEVVDWALQEQITSGSWQLIGYNLGQYSHNLYVRLLMDLVGVEPVSPPPPDLTALSDAGGGDTGLSSTDTGAATSPSVPVPVSLNPAPVGGPAPVPHESSVFTAVQSR